jgi:peptide deformylase
MILPIYTYGLPVLRKVAEEITPDYPELNRLIENMQETLERADGVGLAAPQIGLPIRLVIIDLRPLADDLPAFADFRKTYINAYILDTDGEEVQMEEGCLSLPGIHERVSRPTKVRVRYLDEQFVEHDEWVEGYLARVMQHEFDHLEGRMFIDHISPLRRQMNRGKLNALIAGKAHADYKIKTLRK